MGIEPTFPAWKAGVLPIYDTCKVIGVTGIEPATSWSQTTRAPICATPRRNNRISQRQWLFYIMIFKTSIPFLIKFYILLNIFHFSCFYLQFYSIYIYICIYSNYIILLKYNCGSFSSCKSINPIYLPEDLGKDILPGFIK